MTVVEMVRGLVELTRPVNAVAAGLLTGIGAFVSGAGTDVVAAVTAAVLATVLAVGAGNAINDYFDREIDRINAPDRPIPRGAVEPRTALAFSLVLFAVAIVFALTLELLAIAIAAVNLVALIVYTEWFKGVPVVGNLVVGYLGGSTFLFGAAAVDTTIGSAVVVLFLLASLSTVTREIVKDVEDLEGDREEGLRTLPIAIGERRALHVGTALLVVAVIGSPVPYLQQQAFGLAYLVVIVPAVLVMLYAALESYRNPTTGQSYLKYGMFLAAFAFVIGRVGILL